jgi:hypothetical protein
VQAGSGNRLHRLPRFRWKKVRLQLENILRKGIPAAAQITAQRAGGQLIAPRRATESKIDPPGIERLQRPELFGNHERCMVWKHDSARADADAARFPSHVTNDDRGRRAGDAGKIVMLGHPKAMVAPFLGVLCQVDSITKSQRGISAVDDRREIEQGKCRHGTV